MELAVLKKLTVPLLVVLPRVKFCLLVVKILPVASMESAPLIPAETEAVGVPLPVTLVKANLALLVAVEPRSRSSVILKGESAPWFSCQYS